MLENYWRMARYPGFYQGWGRQKQYFEGWYFKIVSAEQDLAYAVIPGVSMDPKGRKHAFIQVLDGVLARSSYHWFDFGEFRASKDNFAISIGDNHFSADGLELSLPEIEAKLDFKVAKPWPASNKAPGVMGWYGYVPGMQCYHGLISLHHTIHGSLSDHRGKHELNNGIGYTEKDWGTSFPNAWVWMQSNHLDSTQPASLMVSIADIPWLGSSFTGFLSTFLYEGQLHTLATWTGAKASLEITADTVQLTLTDKNCRLEVSGKPGAGGDLASPVQGGMTGKINESLRAELTVSFYLHGELRYQGPAKWAGLEVTDNAQEVLGS